MADKNTFPGAAKFRKGATAVGVAFAVTMAASSAMAMDPLDWGDPGAGLLDNSFGAPTVIGVTSINQGLQGTADGTFFSPNSQQPTGTGIFNPFLQHQRSSASNCSTNDCVTTTSGNKAGFEMGFNTDNPAANPNFSTQNGSGPNDFTRAVTMDEFNLTGGSGFIELVLDANQEGPPGGGKNHIVITNMQIFIGAGLGDPEAVGGGINSTGYAGTQFDGAIDINGVANGVPADGDNTLLGLAPVWELDSNPLDDIVDGTANGNGNVDILLQAAICENKGQCGSGAGDLSVFVPLDNLGPEAMVGTNNFVLYVEYLYANDGFEEWSFRNAQQTEIAEPGTLAVFGLGVIGLGAVRRRRHNRQIKL